ncbi:MAG TPA: hypothetical protein VFO77_03220 [Actinoplanes sp.]|nr:hypothetical protein [Actinoplanes sp.]
MSMIKKSVMVVLGVLAMLLVGTAAHAVLTARGGGIADQHRFVHQTSATLHNSGVFTDVPTAVTSIRIPAGRTRVFDARFSAESQCTGSSGWCSVRIVVVRPNGSVLELDPQSGTDFAFDSVDSTDNWESHAMERTSPRLRGGTYRIKVQTASVGTATLRLDDWTLAVAAVR